MRREIANLGKLFFTLLLSILSGTLIVFLFILFFIGNDNESLAQGDKYSGYGFTIENKGVFTEIKYDGQEPRVYRHKKPTGAVSDAETYPISEDKKLTIRMTGEDVVHIEIDFDRIGILRKKFRRLL